MKPSSTSRHPFFALLCALLLLWPSLSFAGSENPVAPRPSAADKGKFHSGDVVVELTRSESVNRGVVTGLIQAPVAKVRPLVERCWEYANWRTSLKDTTLERRVDSETVICGGTALVPFPARDRRGHFRVRNYTATLNGVDSFISTFQYIDGSGNLNDMFGYWVLQPYGKNGEHTILKHVLNVDIGGWLPSPLVRWATGRILPDTIFGIRKVLTEAAGQKLSQPQFWNSYSYD